MSETPMPERVHPLRMVESWADHLAVTLDPWLSNLSTDAFLMVHYLYTLVALIVLHMSAANLPWQLSLVIAILLAVGRVVVTRSVEERNRKSGKMEGKPVLLPNLDCPRKKKSVSFACMLPKPTTSSSLTTTTTTSSSSMLRLVQADNCHVSVESLQPGCSWINKLLSALWLKQRNFWRQRILTQIWPQINSKMSREGEGSNLQIDVIDLNLGDKPPRITSIDSSVVNDDLILDLALVYKGNATITLKVWPPHLRVQMPSLTLYDFMISNLKIRLIIKHLKPRIPFASGLLVTLLETPVIDWDASGIGKMAELPILNAWIKSKIDRELESRLVLPNRMAFAFHLPLALQKFLDDIRLPYDVKPKEDLEEPDLAGKLLIWVNKAEKLSYSDFGFSHYSSPKTRSLLNPLNPSRFTPSELMPRMGKGKPYVKISVGKREKRSDNVVHMNDGDVTLFHFKCHFDVEKCLMESVVVQIFDEDLFADDPLARVSWSIEDVRKRRVIKGWFNSEINGGRVLMRLVWRPLSHGGIRKVDSPHLGPNSEVKDTTTSQSNVKQDRKDSDPKCQ